MGLDYVTVREAATELRVSEKTVRRWIASGQLKHDRLGAKLIRIRRADLLAVAA